MTNNEMEDKAKDLASDTKSKIEDITKTIADTTAHARDNFAELVKANPFKSVVIAALSGWIIAKL